MSAVDKQISEQTTQPVADIASAIWHAGMEGCGHPDPAQKSWLGETGLLTTRLRDCCGTRFNMRVLRDQPCTNTERLHREVLLCCDEQACIYAVTDVPAATLATHRWLAQLGDEPLGETLQTRADVSRSNFEYALIDGRTVPTSDRSASNVWARKSSFYIGNEALTVIEVFLEALKNCSSTAS